MKSLTVLIILSAILWTAGSATGQNMFSSLNPQTAEQPSSVIEGIQPFGASSGIAHTSSEIYRTDDNGEMWARLPMPVPYGAKLVSVRFHDEQSGIAAVADTANGILWSLMTRNGGHSWEQRVISLERNGSAEDISLLDLASARIWMNGKDYLRLSINLATSSNFRTVFSYHKKAGQASFSFSGQHDEAGNLEGKRFYSLKDEWEPVAKSSDERIKLVNVPSEPVILRHQSDPHSGDKVHSDWFLTQSGSCAGFKTGCVQTTRLYKDASFTDAEGRLVLSSKEITPHEIAERNDAEKAAARVQADNAKMFALPPGGAIRTSLNRGFDKCQAGSVAQMRIWWDNSYHFDTNIYFSGRARACPSQPFTNNPAWIDQVSGMGWGIIPTVVGFQSPCSVSATPHKHSSDPALSEQQGRGEADIAAADAASIGLTAGSVLYYDMERYDETVATPGCRTATVAFLKGWTERIRELGYVSGVYGSPTNAVADWIGMGASRMDAVWLARWDNAPSVWTYASPSPVVPTNIWNNHQRIKQWQAPHNETWGGVTFNIDGNIADGPVAGVAVPRNKVADFDGDGKTDISVFRPGTGRWFVQGTLGPSFSIYEYGTAEDILTPGDYDGDGKTDLVVFRPSNSTWYLRTKGTFSVRQYGEAGDVPAAADYNGDRRTDIAVFRPSTGVWYIANSDSLNTFVQIPFGQAGDRPAAADYDGDGKADIAVWRPSNGTWYVQGSAGNYFTSQWGAPADLPAQADYDGDGRADLAVFRPATGTWYIIQSAGGLRFQGFGVDGDLPATGDYDGDGRYDVAVFRPSNNTWYMSQSLGGFVVREFGAAGDKTIPGAYLPR